MFWICALSTNKFETRIEMMIFDVEIVSPFFLREAFVTLFRLFRITLSRDDKSFQCYLSE